jgi:hypothetical protein
MCEKNVKEEATKNYENMKIEMRKTLFSTHNLTKEISLHINVSIMY